MFRILIHCLLLAAVRKASADDSGIAFWVWNRATPLAAPEHSELRAAGVKRLYWQAGELELRGTTLVLRRTAGDLFDAKTSDQQPEQAGPEIVPVVRVSTAIRSPEQFSGEALGMALRPVVDASPGREVQIDFDCPDRLLSIYAERLCAARRSADIHRLTITALAGWVNVPNASSLWTAVEAVYPMLYDTQTDPAPMPGDPSPCHPRRLLDPAELATQLQNWQRCPVAWYAGLPVFARVTLYDPTGRSRGHLRSWDWEDLVFNPILSLDRPSDGGTTILRARQATRVSQSPVAADSYVAVRTAERSAISAGIVQAMTTGARGVVLFRLPDPPSPLQATGVGWSLPQLLALLPLRPAATANAEPRFSLHRADDGTERWTLRNDSDQDLPPRFDESGRGYGLELELEGGGPGWREALPGEFRRVVGHVFVVSADAASPPDKPAPVAIPLARRLTFWFADSPAHAALTTGLVQLAPGIDPAAVRFRVPIPGSPHSTTWQRPD